MLLVGSSARAQEPSEADVARAKELYLEGRSLYDEARYEEAVAALQEAYRLAPTPGLLYNVASPLERLGRWQEALDALKQYRPDARPEELSGVDRRITALELKVSQERADAEALARAQQQSAEPAKVRKGPPAGAWVLYGVGVAGLGTGAVFTGRALSARGEWTEACTDEPRICPSSSADLVNRDRSSSLVADVAWIVGAAGAGAGLVVSLGGKKSADLTIGAHPSGLWLGGGF